METTIKQIELVRIAGVSRQTIHKAIRSGKIKVNEKRKVVLNDSLTQAWLEGRKPKKEKSLQRHTPNPVHSIITQMELSRISGASKQVIYKAIKAGHVKVNKKRNVVFSDESTHAWLEGQIAKNSKAPQQGMSKPREPETEPVTTLISLQREKILEEIGKIRADKKLKELQYTQKRDTLIEKDTVAAVLFQYIDALNINMLDVPDMIIDTILDKIKAGATRGDVIEIMRKSIRKSIIATKTQIKQRLK